MLVIHPSIHPSIHHPYLPPRTGLLPLGLDLVLGNVVQEDVVGRVGCTELAALAPVVRTGVRKHVALRVEGGARDGPTDGRKSLEPLLVVLVPKVHHAVPPDRGKGPVRVEADGVDAVHVLRLPVALEGERFLPGDLLQVVDAHPALDAAHGEARHVREGRDAARLELEGTFLPAVLPGRAGHVVRYDVPPGRGDDHEVAPDVEGVAPLGKVQGHGGVGAAAVPELELAVPPAAHDHVAGGEVPDVPDGGVVRADLLRHAVGGLLAQLPHPDGLVGAAGEDGVAVGREGRAEGRGLSFVVDCMGWYGS
jgi:hypothetical protein